MKTSFCKCGNRLFFNNHSCIVCGRLVGDCHGCARLSSFSPASGESAPPNTAPPNTASSNIASSDAAAPALPVGHSPLANLQAPSEPQESARSVTAAVWICDQPSCKKTVVPCSNRLLEVCTSFVVGDQPTLCQWCQFTTCLPDLSIEANKRRWAALEAAKRRLLASLAALELPPYIAGLQEAYPLSFEFRAPTCVDGVVQPVVTGHAQGVITINAEEADSDRREATRIALGEPQRTLIGHMRHEIGHYIDWAFASRVAWDEYVDLFGNPNDVDYEQAKQRHYSSGAPTDWPQRHVSAYASMHPWEDFAETVNAYLDIVAIAETARDQQLAQIDTSPTATAERMVTEVLPLAIAISEFNLDLGLQLLLPEHLSQSVIEKLAYVHALRSMRLRERFTEQLTSRDACAAPANR